MLFKDYPRQMFKKIESELKMEIFWFFWKYSLNTSHRMSKRIMEGRLQEKLSKIVVDATKRLVVSSLKISSILIKPNNLELGEMFDVITKTNSDYWYVKKLQGRKRRKEAVVFP